MKGILQRIKKFFSDTFPLHSNASFEALEDALADAEFGIACQRLFTDLLQGDIKELVTTNNAYRRENMHLMSTVMALQQELEAEWQKGVPSLSHSVAVDSYRDCQWDLTEFLFTIPELRMAARLDPKQLTPGYIDFFANKYAADCARDIAAKVKEVLHTARCSGN